MVFFGHDDDDDDDIWVHRSIDIAEVVVQIWITQKPIKVQTIRFIKNLAIWVTHSTKQSPTVQADSRSVA